MIPRENDSGFPGCNIRADHMTLQQVLNTIFEGSDLRYSIRDEKYVMAVSNNMGAKTVVVKISLSTGKRRADSLIKTNMYTGGPVQNPRPDTG